MTYTYQLNYYFKNWLIELQIQDFKSETWYKTNIITVFIHFYWDFILFILLYFSFFKNWIIVDITEKEPGGLYSLWCRKELEATEQLTDTHNIVDIQQV